MTNLNERSEKLEGTIKELSLDLHASKVAISALSMVVSNMSSDPDLLTNLYRQTQSSAPIVKFNHPEHEQASYEEILTERILSLLSQK